MVFLPVSQLYMQLVLSPKWAIQKARLTCQRPAVTLHRGVLSKKFLYVAASSDAKALWRTRNIGIIAHIDAGKTTTTEHVDDGSTVTDFLPAERARGITIQSAAITFHWPPLQEKNTAAIGAIGKPVVPLSNSLEPYTVNLIDTPGHADFAFEVQRSLRILDGAVCILDGVAGVEAQTEKVWYQAAAYKIPKFIYVNKLDRDGAAFGKTIKDIASKLHTWPAVCQIPWFEGGNGRFVGVVDIVGLKALRWPDGGDGKTIKIMSLDELEIIEPKLTDTVRRARMALIELLGDYDDLIIEKYLECNEDHMAILPKDITAALRRCVLNQKNLVPVFAGASFRNIGVQPLLDAVISLLPSPEESRDPEISVGGMIGGLNQMLQGNMAIPKAGVPSNAKHAVSSKKSSSATVAKLETCALAFKVVNDPKRGVLVYVRVYHGVIHRNAMLYNTNLQVSERAPRLLEMYASDAVEVASLSAGQIGVIVGLKHARTGDTLLVYTGTNPKSGPPAPLNTLQLRPIEVPPPVFFASIESQSLSEEETVTNSLALLLREDPSLRLSVDEDSGQTLLSGMGELHLEIARDRLVQDLKAKASMGKIEIGYRECILAKGGPKTALFDRETAGRTGKAACTASVSPLIETSTDDEVDQAEMNFRQDGNVINVSLIPTLGQAEDSISSFTPIPAHLSETIIRTALQNGVLAALARGPQYAYALHSTHVSITLDLSTQVFGTDTSPSALTAAARLATQAALKQSFLEAPTALMEPVMNVIISVDEDSLGSVVHDLSSSRGGHIVSLDDADVVSMAGSSGQTREDIPLIDMRRVYSPPDPFDVTSTLSGSEDSMASNGNRQRTITAKVPLKEMVGYLKHLRSLTAGRGTFVMSVDRFERMGSQREKSVLKEMRGI
ncbi:Ribosome-releasing factor 2, mitochondrial [Xylographa trunciseda]|nr:Ribosome-releasing factor 2, mitochondrial [Xylographa trunciseda]